MVGERKRRRRAWIAVVLVVLPAVYVLSYAPALRWSAGADDERPETLGDLTGDLSLYRPVEWLIDNTSARQPLFWWANVCGVKGQTEDRAFARSLGLTR